jgi:hypothetical protein
VASAVRLRILRLCLDHPLTNKEIAQQVPDPAQVNAGRLGLRLNEEQYQEPSRRCEDLFDELAQWQPGPGAKPYSVFMAIHPDDGRD